MNIWQGILGGIPDVFLDMLTPTESQRSLNTYQRAIMRTQFRFRSTYLVISRGLSKSFTQVLSSFIMAVMYPTIKISLSAETKEQISAILNEKTNEITNVWYPFLKNEIKEIKIGRNYGSVTFHNGSIVDVLANAQTSRGIGKLMPNYIEIYN